jgi:hypothetical protein
MTADELVKQFAPLPVQVRARAFEQIVHNLMELSDREGMIGSDNIEEVAQNVWQNFKHEANAAANPHKPIRNKRNKS